MESAELIAILREVRERVRAQRPETSAGAGIPVADLILRTLALGDDPHKFAHVLIPPRDWCLDRTNSLANRFAGLDNLCKRIDLDTVGAATHTVENSK